MQWEGRGAKGALAKEMSLTFAGSWNRIWHVDRGVNCLAPVLGLGAQAKEKMEKGVLNEAGQKAREK